MNLRVVAMLIVPSLGFEWLSKAKDAVVAFAADAFEQAKDVVKNPAQEVLNWDYQHGVNCHCCVHEDHTRRYKSQGFGFGETIECADNYHLLGNTRCWRQKDGLQLTGTSPTRCVSNDEKIEITLMVQDLKFCTVPVLFGNSIECGESSSISRAEERARFYLERDSNRNFFIRSADNQKYCGFNASNQVQCGSVPKQTFSLHQQKGILSLKHEDNFCELDDENLIKCAPENKSGTVSVHPSEPLPDWMF